MSWFYRHMVRPVLFTQNPEVIHEQMIHALGCVSRFAVLREATESFCGAPDLPAQAFGLRFPNPIGLAAGMDKHGEAVPAWAAMGFGFTELGAVTRHAQPGNDSPRVFRIVPHEAIINRMGFNNPGAEVVAQTLAKWRERGCWPRHPVGMNLGKSKITPLAEAPEDYAFSFRALWPLLDFFVVNVSSPNTPNLRQLQDKSALDEILAALQRTQAELVSATGQPAKPILVKVAPDLTFEALDEILALVVPRQVAGIIATNTTITRPETSEPGPQRLYRESGGLSGKPLRVRSTEVIRHLYRQSKGQVPIVGVGGIFTVEDAWEKITAGSALLQIYTGMVYEGPTLARRLVIGLNEKLRENGMQHLAEAVGMDRGM
jgi:dihydroorotate dehydrogenase